MAESLCSFLHNKNLNTKVNPRNIALQEALYKEALYELSKFILMHTIQQKYAFIASLTNNGANTVHHALSTTPSILRAKSTENIVIVIKFIHISKTVSPIHCTISLSVKNIFYWLAPSMAVLIIRMWTEDEWRTCTPKSKSSVSGSRSSIRNMTC